MTAGTELLSRKAWQLGHRAVQVASVVYDSVRRPPAGITFLIYHRVGARTRTSIDIPTPLFRSQIAELAASQRAIGIDTALTHLAPGVTRGARSPDVVVTFDDGTADWVEEALPVLVEHRVPAVFYVATAFVEERRPFPGQVRPVSWRGLADMVSTGLVTIGSHTHNHLLLHDVDATTARDELDRSVGLIEDKLGVPCRHFAYPKAVLGSVAAQAAVRARFASATLAGGRANPVGADLHRLQRTPVLDRDALAWFRRKAGGGMVLEGTLREAYDHRRYRASPITDDEVVSVVSVVSVGADVDADVGVVSVR